MTTEYCLLQNGIVINVIVSTLEFAEQYATSRGYTVIQRPSTWVGIGHAYHDGKFWYQKADQCVGGMIHEGETEPCAGGEWLSTSHEEVIV